tara:strand:- start:2154 stop:3293 length:1140 start_codon:yes stop_codon:yes gene_type:complete
MSRAEQLRRSFRRARAAGSTSASKAGMQKKQGKSNKSSASKAGMQSKQGGGSGSSSTAQKFKAPSGMGSTPIGGFGEEIKNITNPQDILNKSKEIFETEKAKDIRKKADEMFALIKANPTLTNFQKNNIREQIQFVKDNHGRLGYSLNELMSAVGTNAFNQIVSRTPIDRDTAQKLGVTDKVQDLMDKYGREAVLRGFDSAGNPIITARSPTAGELFADMGRGAAKLFAAGPITQFFTGGKGFDIKPPEFGFGDIPVSAASQYLGGAFPQFQPQGLTSFATPQSVGASKALASAPIRDARAGRTPEVTTEQQGDGSGDGGGGNTSSTFAYVPFARPVSYNYMGGPEQMYLGGGFTQDGVPVGPFRAADGGIANFKGYGY